MEKIFKQALLVAIITFVLDFTFHWLFTKPMESLTYFVLKFLLSFFVAAGLFSLKKFYSSSSGKAAVLTVVASLVFSTLMSAYYRAWELVEAGAPWGSRAPDIIGLTRYSLLFAAVWWLAHASFFAVGALMAKKLPKNS